MYYRLETKINAPPKDVEEQKVPRSLERVMKLQDAVKSGKIGKLRKRKKTKNALITVGDAPKPLHPKLRPEKVVPIFQQQCGESKEHFLNRVNRDTHNFIQETAFETKYGVQVNRNPETGNIEGLTKCSMNEIDKIEMLRAKHKNIKKKKKKKGTDEVKMTKSQKKREKLKLKKEKRELENVNDFENIKDQVEFGEVVHEPPQIKIRPKAADSATTAKVHILEGLCFLLLSVTEVKKYLHFLLQPGKKNLLLHSLLTDGGKTKVGSKKGVSTDKSGKLRNLPIGQRRQVEKDQNDVIEAYKRLKAQRSAGIN